MPPISFAVNNLQHVDAAVSLGLMLSDHISKEDATRFFTKEDWIAKLNNKAILVTAISGSELAGFMFAYPQDDTNLLIWLSGVHTKYTNQKVVSNMYLVLLDYAKKQGFSKLSYQTYKDRFALMYFFMLKHGFKIVKNEKKQTASGAETVKTYFEKVI